MEIDPTFAQSSRGAGNVDDASSHEVVDLEIDDVDPAFFTGRSVTHPHLVSDQRSGRRGVTPNRPAQRIRLDSPVHPTDPTLAPFGIGIPSGPYHDAPAPGQYLTDLFQGWGGLSDRQSLLSEEARQNLAAGAKRLFESFALLTYGACQLAAELSHMRQLSETGGGTGPLIQQLAQLQTTHEETERALAACKYSLELAQAQILYGTQRWEREVEINNQLRLDLEAAQGKLNDAQFLVDLVKGSPAFLVVEHNAMRRGVEWSVRKFTTANLTLPFDQYLHLFDSMSTRILANAQVSVNPTSNSPDTILLSSSDENFASPVDVQYSDDRFFQGVPESDELVARSGTRRARVSSSRSASGRGDSSQAGPSGHAPTQS